VLQKEQGLGFNTCNYLKVDKLSEIIGFDASTRQIYAVIVGYQ
jgi:hypothetical protein